MTLTGEFFLDTENLFHGLQLRLGKSNVVSRTLHGLVIWLHERSGARAGAVHSYGKSVDRAVVGLRHELQRSGQRYVRHERGRTPTPGGERMLVDFAASLPLDGLTTLEVDHVDVPHGKDEAELRLIADLEMLRADGRLPDWCVLGSADHRVLAHVDQIGEDAVRERFLIVIPRSGATLVPRLAERFPHLRAEHVAIADELRVRAAKAAQDPTGPRRRRASTPPQAPPPDTAIAMVSTLRTVDWRALANFTPDEEEWDRLLGAAADGVRRAFGDTAFVRRFDAPRRRAAISALRAGHVDVRIAQYVVSCAALYDALRDDAGLRSRVRSAATNDPQAGFVRHALDAIQPLLGEPRVALTSLGAFA